MEDQTRRASNFGLQCAQVVESGTKLLILLRQRQDELFVTKMNRDVSTRTVAKWMADKLAQSDCLFQETIALEIASRFGKEFTYPNANGNLAIRKSVRVAFRKLAGRTVVWDRRTKIWRKRADLPK